MHPKDFVVHRRPHLARIKHASEDGVRRLRAAAALAAGRASAHPAGLSRHAGTGAFSCSRAGTPPARAGSCGGWAGRSIRAASRCIRSPRPTSTRRAQHYLQRFWSRLPEKGQIVTFDRSWYGRVLVERVEGFATTREWRRAYREINEFEHVLARFRHPPRQAVPAYYPGRAGAPVPRPPDRSAEAVEAFLRGFPQPHALVGLRGGDRGHDGEDLDQSRAVASDPVEQQTL